MSTKKISALPACGPLAGAEKPPLVQGATTVSATLDELPLSTAALVALALKQDASTAATDTELASTVATLTSAIATKQNLSTAATDAELAAAQAALTTAIAAVQASVDALGAAGATDAEVAGAVAALAATVATDAELAAAVAVDRARLVALETALQWAANPDSLISGAITRDANEAATSAPVIWPDGATGTYTATIVSTAFPGAVDAYTITHVLSGTTLTYTQPAVTRDVVGGVTNRPAITIT